MGLSPLLPVDRDITGGFSPLLPVGPDLSPGSQSTVAGRLGSQPTVTGRPRPIIRVSVHCYNTTLLPSGNTLIAREMFCGAKYTHHTFTPIIKHF